jgi:hypothetical protein
VDGLEPVAANVLTRAYSGQDGEFPNGATVGKRNLVAKIGLLLPTSRDVLYAYFLPKNDIKLRLDFDYRDPVFIDGTVENHVPAGRFSDAPELPTMQVSIICPKPNFLSELHTINDWTDATEESDVPVNVPYSGTTGGGFFLQIDTAGNDFSSPLKIVSELGGNKRIMEFKNLNIVGGWAMFISTHPGLKIAEFRPVNPALVAAGVKPISFLNAMKDTYFWTQFFAGMQHFQVITEGNNQPRPWSLVYADQFAGV